MLAWMCAFHAAWHDAEDEGAERGASTAWVALAYSRAATGEALRRALPSPYSFMSVRLALVLGDTWLRTSTEAAREPTAPPDDVARSMARDSILLSVVAHGVVRKYGALDEQDVRSKPNYPLVNPVPVKEHEPE